MKPFTSSDTGIHFRPMENAQMRSWRRTKFTKAGGFLFFLLNTHAATYEVKYDDILGYVRDEEFFRSENEVEDNLSV